MSDGKYGFFRGLPGDLREGRPDLGPSARLAGGEFYDNVVWMQSDPASLPGRTYAESLQRVIRQTDEALYRAKRSGKNRVEFAE